jgi:UDP-glucose 4-epimerase
MVSEAYNTKALVTGGAGFIGSRLSSALVKKGYHVVALDDLSSGDMSNLVGLKRRAGFEFIKADCRKKEAVRSALKDVDVVFHLAARPDVRLRPSGSWTCFTENVLATEVVLEAAQSSGTSRFVLASSSTVYGEATLLPTPEEYSPLHPISLYGASKLASEALLIGHSNAFGLDAVILRLANVVGEGSPRGVVHDFVERLNRNPLELEVLGDGRQRKSYLYVDDCVGAMIQASEGPSGIRTYNVGSEDQADVLEIAKVVSKFMDLNPRLNLTGGVGGGRGWVGDVKSMLLDVSRLKELGWRPNLSSIQSIEKTLKMMKGGIERSRA